MKWDQIPYLTKYQKTYQTLPNQTLLLNCHKQTLPLNCPSNVAPEIVTTNFAPEFATTNFALEIVKTNFAPEIAKTNLPVQSWFSVLGSPAVRFPLFSALCLNC